MPVRTARQVLVRSWPMLLLALGCVLSSSCATLMHGRTQEITVTSDPIGARVYVGNDLVGVTPARLLLRRRQSGLVLRFEKEGYTAAEVPLERTVSRWIAGDVAWGASQFANQGLPSPRHAAGAAATVTALSLGSDVATGSAYRLSPAQLRVTLVPVQGQ